MDPFQLTMSIIAGVYVVCNCCLQMGTHSRLESIHRDGQAIYGNLSQIQDQLGKIRCNKQAKPNIFTGIRVDTLKMSDEEKMDGD